MLKAAVYVRIKAANLREAPHLEIFSFANSITPLNPPAPTVLPKNGSAEIYNNKFAIRTRTLLYGSGLPAKFWSAALLHSVYLHNRLAHSKTKKTPFEGYYGRKRDLSTLKLFGACVCVKRTGERWGKLDRHDFTGVFLDYTATEQNITYLDLDSGIVKTSYHAQFDEAWYLQPTRPPAAQLLYDLGLENEVLDNSPTADASFKIPVPWPAFLPKRDCHLSLRSTTCNRYHYARLAYPDQSLPLPHERHFPSRL
jgi:hypothetical protein